MSRQVNRPNLAFNVRVLTYVTLIAMFSFLFYKLGQSILLALLEGFAVVLLIIVVKINIRAARSKNYLKQFGMAANLPSKEEFIEVIGLVPINEWHLAITSHITERGIYISRDSIVRFIEWESVHSYSENLYMKKPVLELFLNKHSGLVIPWSRKAYKYIPNSQAAEGY